MNIHILTLFPEMYDSMLQSSILGRAISSEILNVDLINFRDYAENKHNNADDSPYGGGAGMLLMPQPLFDAIDAIDTVDTIGVETVIQGNNDILEDRTEISAISTQEGISSKISPRYLYMSPRGRVLDYELSLELSREKEIVILCGHYEGVDQRVLDYYDFEEVSIGDYVLTGGELASMVLIDSMARFIPGVLGNEDSHDEESIYSGLLEYPQYTRPATYADMDVPEVLLSGNHQLIELWRYEQSLILTKSRRPDLWSKYVRMHKDDKVGLGKKKLELLKKYILTFS
ncbi:MAG: tRNA (guanosine(37)-N1)-methyltransferase TrmD [Clostridiales Family XIII bacterium]|nr:tRNA (guanosine(37)-N1)-methyltransferase TrmD [Clostridiales Family XIII bacterium]